MRLEIATCTDTGQVREHNEDAIAHDTTLGLVVLADGMGGYQAGEIASAIAVKTIVHTLQMQWRAKKEDTPPTRTPLPIAMWLENAVLQANKAIYQAAESQLSYRGMGTTVVAAMAYQQHINIAHVGDSRLYRWRQGELRQLTVDHSVLQELIDCGFYTREQARHSPNKNLVTRALGVAQQVEVSIQTVETQIEDIYLLCSDGLNDMLDDTQLKHLLDATTTDTPLQQIAQNLVDAANNAGGEDNISVILLKLARDTQTHAPREQDWFKRFIRGWWG